MAVRRCKQHDSRTYPDTLRGFDAFEEVTAGSIFHYQAKVGRGEYDQFKPNDMWVTEMRNASQLSSQIFSDCVGMPGPELDGYLKIRAALATLSDCQLVPRCTASDCRNEAPQSHLLSCSVVNR